MPVICIYDFLLNIYCQFNTYLKCMPNIKLKPRMKWLEPDHSRIKRMGENKAAYCPCFIAISYNLKLDFYCILQKSNEQEV